MQARIMTVSSDFPSFSFKSFNTNVVHWIWISLANNTDLILLLLKSALSISEQSITLHSPYCCCCCCCYNWHKSWMLHKMALFVPFGKMNWTAILIMITWTRKLFGYLRLFECCNCELSIMEMFVVKRTVSMSLTCTCAVWKWLNCIYNSL